MFEWLKFLRGKRPGILSDAFLAKIIRSSCDYACLWLDEKGKVQWANVGAIQILRYREDELYGRYVGELFTEDDRRAGVPEEELRRAKAEGRAEDERWHVRRNGERFWATGVMSYMTGDGDQTAGFHKVFRDINARKTTEDEVRVANANLRSFSHTAAHDLKAPLRTISLTLQLALRQHGDALPADLKRSLENVSESARHMKELIDSILVHSEVGMKAERFRPVDTNAIFDMAVSFLRSLIEESGAAITKGSLPEVLAVPEEIERLFQNLITNAIKYRGAESPKLHVEAKPVGDAWTFSATDNGIGISPENHERIFDSFQRLHSSDDRPGTGLGLAICKKIIELHRGRIWVESTVGRGATFHFTLPKAQ